MVLPESFLCPTEFPEPLRKTLHNVQSHLNDSLTAAERAAQASDGESPLTDWLALSEARRRELARVVALSDYVSEALMRQPRLLMRLDASQELDEAPSREAMASWLAEGLETASDETQMQACLRRFRRARMVGIIWRDLARSPCDREQMWRTAASVSQLAEVCLDGALSWLEEHLTPRWGTPAPRADDTPQRLVVLGMGKFGAGELNLSSDIDLIFAFAEKGQTQGGRKSLDHQEYFTKLGQKLIAALDSVSAEGFVFRVDMRLRPLGEGGPLVGSFAMLSSYYQDQGREWERYAMLKARPVAGDLEAGRELLAELKPFVYRKYLDFGAIESLREMKSLINREVKRKGLANNIKLGAGGIREVEFVVQVFQLIRGGRDTELQMPSLRQALQHLPGLGLLPAEVVDELSADYVFLRDMEHALQAQQDRQTQTLPDNELGRERLALAMQAEDWPALMARLGEVRGRVQKHFDAVIAPPEDDVEPDTSAEDDRGSHSLEELRALWRDELTPEEAVALLEEAGFAEPESVLKRLGTLRHSRQVQSMQRIGYERLDALMPLLLTAVASSESPDRVMERILPLIEAVLRRTAYLALLRENPEALPQLVKLCAASPWIADQLARHPLLLDELLHPATLYSPADKAKLADELRQALARIPEDDEEAQLEALRNFKHAQVLHVAASDIAGARPLMKVSDYLTYIAEVVLEQVLAMAWKHLVRKHGRPKRQGNDVGEAGFAVIGYGKLGGIELGYGSDLDLVFLHDGASQGSTDGPRIIDNAVFFTRLGQRIIHLLTAVTPAGALYDVDMRLRPSGNAGLLVTSLDAYAEYQRHQAWTWEHQALVRARPVVGSAALIERFDAVRCEILGRQRDREVLRSDVVDMRHKMRSHLGSSESAQREGWFHLKQDAGGMVDIEFLCQYAVLAMGHEAPELLRWSDNMRILETLEASGRLPADDARRLREAYLAYRNAAHRTALTKGDVRVRDQDFHGHRQAVRHVWQMLLEPDRT
ncbi:bifunctional [glutamate--ammonia ligase]-adenylyl-L-tyrosine phosphorylase/[glutamate--ammonia-ligase] adenylyltransferase [Halomonas sp. WWR20]